VALVFAQLTDRRVRAGLAALLNRRLVAPDLLRKYLAHGPGSLSLETVARGGAERLLAVFGGMRGGLERFITSGPVDPEFALVAGEIERLERQEVALAGDPVAIERALREDLGFALPGETIVRTVRSGVSNTRFP